MPQKYDKHMRPLAGFRANEDVVREVKEQRERRAQKTADRERARKFMAEPEELKILAAIEKLPDAVRADAAEAMLVARVARRKKLVRC